MTTRERTWVERVRAWRDSGVSAREFSSGRGFSSSGLYKWARHLKGSEIAAELTTPRVRMVRVDRVASVPAALVVEVGTARVVVPAGFDAATVEVVLRALSRPAVAGAR